MFGASIAAKDLVRLAVAKGSRDDCTALVIDLFKFEKEWHIR